MFEILVSPRAAEKNPFSLFFVGLLYSSLSLLLTTIITKSDAILMNHASMLIITFTTVFSIPFIHSLIRREEIKNITEKKRLNVFAGHSKALLALLFLFLGFLVAFSFWYIIMPQNFVAMNFKSQIEKFCAINQNVEQCLGEYGMANTLTGHAVSGISDVYSIFMNNIYVLLFTLLFSLAFGAGAIFILAWNASVIATAIGMLVKIDFAQFYMPFLMYMFHGIPEIFAYLVIALAGGILSTAVIRRDFKHFSSKLLADIIMLVVLSVVILFIAALIEVYITPLLFG